MKTHRGLTAALVGIIAIALVIVAAIVIRQYYQDRYTSDEFFAMVPLDFDATPETIYSDNGEDIGPGKKYVLTAFDKNGASRSVAFTAYAPGSSMVGARELPNPGEYLLIKASKTIVTSWSVTNKGSVPEKALSKIETP